MAGFPSTDFIAWYGAILATVVLVFNIWKWSRSRPRLRVRIRANIYYDDGGVASVEKTPTGEIQTLIPYYHIEVTNVGELPTTILGVSATTRAKGILEKIRQRGSKFKGEMSYFGRGFIPHYGKAPPHVLSSGEVWSCRVQETAIDGLYQAGFPKLELTAACYDRPVLVAFPLKHTDSRKSDNST